MDIIIYICGKPTSNNNIDYFTDNDMSWAHPAGGVCLLNSSLCRFPINFSTSPSKPEKKVFFHIHMNVKTCTSAQILWPDCRWSDSIIEANTTHHTHTHTHTTAQKQVSFDHSLSHTNTQTHTHRPAWEELSIPQCWYLHILHKSEAFTCSPFSLTALEKCFILSLMLLLPLLLFWCTAKPTPSIFRCGSPSENPQRQQGGGGKQQAQTAPVSFCRLSS